ncbi:MAG: addiction module protein [Eubacteriales bacterium]|uniref:addiction module protein n=1 Tax=Syntrophomonas sp. TaxID=2053627 RepID=UPI002613E4B4|nr:addiction module protein [Syntrophomonas sp.]MDD2215690.1 addiction module protein [Eubacteriales bacterium]MDD4627472.1 addiction module protein [Syntrophomonas sp.]
MSIDKILKQALNLKIEERFILLESFIKSIDDSGQNLDDLWAEEAKKRLAAYREGRWEDISMEEMFKNGEMRVVRLKGVINDDRH